MLSLLKTPFLSAGAHAIADILEDSALTGLLVAFNDPAESRFDTRGKRAPGSWRGMGALFRRRRARSDGASRRPEESLRSNPFPAAESVAKRGRPSPATGECGNAGNSRSRT